METRRARWNINAGYAKQIIDLLKEHQIFNILAIEKDDDAALNLAVQISIDSGVDLNSKSKKYETILVLAILKRAEEVIDFLLARKVAFDHSVTVHLIEEEIKKFVELQEQSEMTDNEKRKVESKSAKYVEWLILKQLDFDFKKEEKQSASSMAMEHNLQHILVVLLKYTKDIKCVDKANKTLLHSFIDFKNNPKNYRVIDKTWYGDQYAANIVKILLERGVSVDAEDKNKCTAVGTAIEKNEDFEIIEILLEYLTNVNQKNSKGETLIHKILKKWAKKRTDKDYYIKIARKLVDKGVDVNEPDNSGMRPVFHAIKVRDLRMVEFLQEYGADFNVTAEYGDTPLDLLILRIDYEQYRDTTDFEAEMKLFQLVLAYTTNVNAKGLNFHRSTLFHRVIEKWASAIERAEERDIYREMALALIAKGADVNKSDKFEETPLSYVVRRLNLCIFEFLQENGADFIVIRKNGQTLMHCLADSMGSKDDKVYLKMFATLVSNGCQLSTKDESGNTPLHVAADRRKAVIVRKLLEHGVDVNSRNNAMQTPLIYMASNWMGENSIEPVKLLLHHGADVNAKDINGFTALHAAAINKARSGYFCNVNITILRLLLKYAADFDASCMPGSAAAHVVEFMLKHWIKLNVANLKCCTLTERQNSIIKATYYTEHYEECLKEIETLKTTFINSSITLYDLLHMNLHRRRFYVNSEDLQKLLYSPVFETQFPQYSIVIWASYHEALTRRSLFQSAKEAWIELIQIDLSDVCNELIFSYLTNSELFNIIEQN